MRTAAFARYPLWKYLYMAALFENDRSKVPSRIKDAEAEIVERARALSPSGDNLIEAKALDYSLHMLQILKGCLNAETA